MTCVLGIDPGLFGGVALYDVAADRFIEARPMPVETIQDGRYKYTNLIDEEFACMIADLVEAHDVKLVLIEKVHSSPQQGVASAFKFGDGFGAIRMACKIYAPRVEFVTPQRWKAKMMVSFNKKDSLAKARELFGREWFPKEKHEGLAEAALISLYAARHYDLTEEVQPVTDEEEDPLS